MVSGQQADDGDQYRSAETDDNQSARHVLRRITRADPLGGGQEGNGFMAMAYEEDERAEPQASGDNVVQLDFHMLFFWLVVRVGYMSNVTAEIARGNRGTVISNPLKRGAKRHDLNCTCRLG